MAPHRKMPRLRLRIDSASVSATTAQPAARPNGPLRKLPSSLACEATTTSAPPSSGSSKALRHCASMMSPSGCTPGAALAYAS